jgi:photosystem II stability/assembly factor-like uncharacterized protein
MKSLRLFICCLIVFSNTENLYSQQISFSSMGGPYGGSLGDIVFTSTGEFYVSAYYFYNKGVFKSTDNGVNWQYIIPDTAMPWLDYFAMGVNQYDDVFAGTNGGGIYKSSDSGETWSRLIAYHRPECWAIAFNDSDHVFAGDGDNGGVLKSIDNGATWTQVLPNSVAPLAIEINEEGIIFIGTRDNFYKSTNNGDDWISCYQGLDNQIIASILTYSSSEIYVGTGYSTSGNGVYYSSNLGNTWEQKGLNGKIVYSLTSDQFGNIYASTNNEGIYKSLDQGETWRQINQGLKNFDIFRIQMTPDNMLFACSESEGGIYKSIDYGESWQIIGMVAGTMWQGVITELGNIYAATDGGVQKYNSSSGSWSAFGLNKVKSNIIDKDGVLFAGTRWNGVYASYDDGNTWNLTAPIGGTGTELFTMALYPDNSLLLGTNDFIKRSTDKGTSWTTINTQLPSSIIGNLHVTTDGKIYASSGTNLCKTNDVESDFIIIRDSLYLPQRNGMAPGNNGLLFLTDIYFNPGIFKSTDYGFSWQKISDKLASSISVFDDNYIVTGHDNGEIMFSFDQGETFLTVSEELPANSTIYWSQIDPYGYLYCAASGFGLFRSNTIVTSVGSQDISEPISFSLKQNYPNPFNSSTNIKYTISQSGRVTLTVYDIMGRVVSVLLDRYQEAGSYDVIFQPKDLASGIYFYTLTSGNFMSTKKLILLK